MPIYYNTVSGSTRASDAMSNYSNGPHNGWKYAGYGYHVPTAVKNHIDQGGTVFHGSGGTRLIPKGYEVIRDSFGGYLGMRPTR